MEKISRHALEATISSCRDYMHKDNSGNLRERYAFLFLNGKTGIYLVECNTSGVFLMNNDAGLQEAFRWISST